MSDPAKPRMELIPGAAMRGMARAFTDGADKYSDHGYREMPQGDKRIAGALLRHLTAWLDGEKVDPDSGLSHLDHVAANAAILCWFAENGVPERGPVPSPEDVYACQKDRAI